MLILLFGGPSSINNIRKDLFIGKNNNKKERKNNKQKGTKNPNIKKYKEQNYGFFEFLKR
jgi:hypothetical protein